MPTPFDKYATLTERTDCILRTKENATINTLHKSLSASFDLLELNLRRVYPADMSAESILNRQATAAALLSQVKVSMQVVNPAQALEYEKVLGGLLSETQDLAIATGHKSLDLFEPGVAVFAPRIPIEVAEAAAEQAINRLEKHGKDFASAAAVTITQGILQRWSIDQTVRALRLSQDIAKSNAEMIVRTETLSAYNTAAVVLYEENGIDYVIRYATADDRTCVVCGGRAGEITAIGKEQATLHPRCRCYFAPYKKEWAKSDVFDLGALDAFAKQVRAAHPTPEKLNGVGLSSFEKSAGMTNRSAVFRRPGAIH
jgi:SPP1 gp7 family putative phage head morphogenesis protein